jgi:hypothetical protein
MLAFSTLAAAGGCGRWQPARSYQVEGVGDPERAYRTAREVLEARSYEVVEQSDAERRVVVRTRVDRDDDQRKSYISVQVTNDGKVVLSPSGFLVRADGSMHAKLSSELDALENDIAAKLRAVPASGEAFAGDAGSPVPVAWTEPAYDPATWGPGDFTCIPIELPPDAQSELRLLLSTGEQADVVLSLAYAPELCRSPSQCTLPKGCPALGLGDAHQVGALAQRLASAEVTSQATLIHRGTPIATLDLGRHGSIAQALSQLGAGANGASDAGTPP